MIEPGCEGIRERIHSFQYAVESEITRRKRQNSMSEQHQLNALSNLPAGDNVRHQGKVVTVKTVDRFKQSEILRSSCYAHVHLSSISLADSNKDVPPKKAKEKKKNSQDNNHNKENSGENFGSSSGTNYYHRCFSRIKRCEQGYTGLPHYSPTGETKDSN